MKTQSEKFDLDPAQFGDEELVILDKECGFQPAQTELTLRYLPTVQKLIRRWARRSGLSAPDLEDAEQDGVLSLVHAIARYDTAQLALPHGFSFRCFAERVLRGGYLNQLKHECRVAQHQREYRAVMQSCETHGAIDAAEWWDARARLQPALNRLDARERSLTENLLQGMHLCDAAVHLRISYRTAKRWRKRILAKLGEDLRAEVET